MLEPALHQCARLSEHSFQVGEYLVLKLIVDRVILHLIQRHLSNHFEQQFAGLQVLQHFADHLHELY